MDLKEFLTKRVTEDTVQGYSQKQLEQLKKIQKDKIINDKIKEDYFTKPKTNTDIEKEKYKTIIDYLYSS